MRMGHLLFKIILTQTEEMKGNAFATFAIIVGVCALLEKIKEEVLAFSRLVRIKVE